MGKREKEASGPLRLNISLPALNDLDEITDFIAHVNGPPLNAVKVSDAIFTAIDKIGKNPFIYKECEAIPTKTKMYRQAICMSWLVINKFMKSESRVLGIIHSTRRLAVIKTLRKVK